MIRNATEKTFHVTTAQTSPIDVTCFGGYVEAKSRNRYMGDRAKQESEMYVATPTIKNVSGYSSELVWTRQLPQDV